MLCEGYCHSSFPRYRGGIEAHGDMLWGCVLWVQWYTSGQSKTIRIAVPAVMAGLTMSFVISFTLLTIIKDAITGNNLISSWFGMLYSWFGDRTVQPGWLFRMVGPMQQGMLYSVGLILFNYYLTIFLNSKMFIKCCLCK